MVRFVAISGGVLLGAASVALGTCGLAAANSDPATPQTVGQTLSNAQTAFSGMGVHPVIQTILGDRTAQSNCLVTRQQLQYLPAPENAEASGSTQVLLGLNCNAGVATVTTPGPSPESPEGQAGTAAAAAAAAKASAAPAS
jgi:hypothetical protein